MLLTCVGTVPPTTARISDIWRRDDVLSEAAKLVIVSVFELGARHIDRT
jgi:hypothetical protein